jgi:hypothetical protein
MKMSATKIKQNLLNAKGQFCAVKWESIVKTSAQFNDLVLTKITQAVVKSGIDFGNLKTVKDGIESGERSEVGSLPWGEWIEFPYTIGHKGNEYVRLYPSVQNIPQVQYFVDGLQVSKANFASYLTASSADRMLNFDVSNQPECFTIKADNILAIG